MSRSARPHKRVCMQPIQFPCGYCGKLMAVSSENVGQQVRCPHCQQIVIAPPPAPPEPASGAVETPSFGSIESVLQAPLEDLEHIFSPPEATEDLFGRSELPRIELPPELPATPLGSTDAAPAPEIQPTSSAAPPWAPPETTSAPPPASR